MEGGSSRNNRIAKNTILLYFRMLLLMGVSLYTSRIVLEALGIEDYGVYNVVGGFVTMFAFLNGAMGASTMRYITFALGKGDSVALKKTFAASMMTHIIISVIVFVVAETIGLWFVVNKLVIPPGQLTAAIVVFECSIVSTILIILSYPFYADIIAHEKMAAFAYISIFEALAKLGIVYVLLIGHSNRLILYGILIMIVQFIVVILYNLYCRKHFNEANFKLEWDSKLVKEMFSFTGWNLWGGLAATLFGQGLNILLNIFFGPAINAARGIAVQVQSTVNQFAANFQTAINPQITKTYAMGEYESMYSLIFRSSKFTFLLLLILALPLGSEINWVLKVWLGEVPDFTGVFILIMLATTIIDAISNPLMIAVSATGKVKFYQSVVGGILLLIVPISYVVLKLGGQPYSVFIVHLSIAGVAFMARILILRKQIALPVRKYIRKALIPCFIVCLISIIIVAGLKYLAECSEIHSVLMIVVIGLSTAIASYIFGLTSNEKIFVINKAEQTLFNLRNRFKK